MMEPQTDLSTWQPRPRPERAPIDGMTVRLEPINASRHAAALFAGTRPGPDHDVWIYLPDGPFERLEDYEASLREREQSDDPLHYAIIDRATGQPIGSVAYLRITPEHGVIEIGHVLFTPAMQRTRRATESIFLLLQYAFDNLGYRRVEWKCNSLNTPSRRAAERFGFQYEGLFRQHTIVKGRNRDTTWYAMLDHEWPLMHAAFNAWLAPENFSADGQQQQSLTAIRAGISQEVTTQS